MSRFRAGMALSLGATLLCACAGTGTNNRIGFDRARVPVSLSSYVPDPRGQILGPQKLERVGDFRARKRAWSTLFGFVPLHTVDFSDELNARVAELGGEAVVDLKLTVIDSGTNWWLFFTWFPLWPGSAKVTVEGAVVRRAGAPARAESRD